MIEASSFERVGLVINPVAGGDAGRSMDTGRRALQRLGVRAVATGRGALGADAARGLETLIAANDDAGGRDATRALARALAGSGLEIVIVVGGDGTMADVAAEFSAARKPPAVLGIGAGSANAGALITCKAANLDALAPAALDRQMVDALLVVVGRERALAFNDVVIAATLVGTEEGRLVDLDAAAMLAGKRRRAQPRPVGSPEAEVRVKRAAGIELMARGEEVATVVVGFCNSAYFAKAVTGGACLAALCGLPAAVVVADQPLVRVEIDASALLALPPLRTAFLALDERSRVLVRGMASGAVVCADGNPLAACGPGVEVRIEYRPGAVTALRLGVNAA